MANALRLALTFGFAAALLLFLILGVQTVAPWLGPVIGTQSLSRPKWSPIVIEYVFGFGAVVGLIIGTVFEAGEESQEDTEFGGPHGGLRQELPFRLSMGVVIGLIVWVVVGFGIRSGMKVALVYGLAYAFVTWLWLAEVWIRYAIGVTCAAMRGRLPIRLKSFMLWACDSGLLRIAGTTYQFRHRELQAWLTQNARINDPQAPNANLT